MPYRHSCVALVLFFVGAQASYGGLIDRLTEDVTGAATVEKRCREGDAKLCSSAGNMYRSGYKVSKDMARAIEFYTLGCQQGDSSSCHSLYEIGFDDAYGKRVPVNKARAFKVFSVACEGAGQARRYHGGACQELAKFFRDGKHVEKDRARARALLTRGCDKPNRRACRDLADLLLDADGPERDVAAALDALARACEGKNKEPRACARLGVMLASGDQVTRDPARAESYLVSACTFPKRIGQACYELARLYEQDLTGLKSAKEVTDLYHVACHDAESKRSGDACVAAAARQLKGQGARPEPNWVSELYSRGCQLKHERSCRLACELHCKGGQPHACAALKANKPPLGVANCFKP